MPIEIDTIARLLPHAGNMCLLEQVLSCTPSAISCRTRTHLKADNPLRCAQGLRSAIAIEYAAQAMALHARLQVPEQCDAASEPGQHGVLASVRRTHFLVPYLDLTDDDLLVEATLVSGDPKTALYEFTVSSEQRKLVTGRATVLLITTSSKHAFSNPEPLH